MEEKSVRRLERLESSELSISGGLIPPGAQPATVILGFIKYLLEQLKPATPEVPIPPTAS